MTMEKVYVRTKVLQKIGIKKHAITDYGQLVLIIADWKNKAIELLSHLQQEAGFKPGALIEDDISNIIVA